MRSINRMLRAAIAGAGFVLIVPVAASAHPLLAGSATGAQAVVLAAGAFMALWGWLIIAGGRRAGRRSPVGYALLIGGILAFIAGPDILSAAGTYLSGPRPTTSVRLEVLDPPDGQVFSSTNVPVRIRLSRPRTSDQAPAPMAPVAKDQGSIHVVVDGRLVSLAWQPSQLVAMSPGAHTVTVEYVSRDQRSFSPPVAVTRQITVRPPGVASAPRPESAPVAVLRWTHWNWDPAIVLSLAVAIVGYLSIARRFHARRRQMLYFCCGMAVLTMALLSPLDVGAEYLFTIHMVQHMLLLLVAPPLLAMAVPPAFLGQIYRQPGMLPVLRFLWSPVTSFILFNGVLLLWHLPFAYDATLRYGWAHALEHMSFVGAGMIFWGVVVSPAPKLVRASYGVRLALVVAADLVNFLLGFGLAFAGRPLYPHYAQAPRLWGITPLDDLHLGGAVMWTMGQMMYAVPMLILLNVLLRGEGAGSAPAGPLVRDA